MIEMLGVLTIIGLLMLGGLAGYTIAMNYYKANETVHDVMLRASNVPMMYDNYLDIVNPEHEYIFADLGGRNPVGYDVDTFAEDEMSDYVYRVVVKEVPKVFVNV